MKINLLYGACQIVRGVDFFSGHYERAEKEETLRRLEVERKLCIQYMIPNINAANRNGKPVSLAINYAIQNAKIDLNDVLMDRDNVYNEKHLRKRRYFLVALKKLLKKIEDFWKNFSLINIKT